jgi:hypothetical protein
MQEPGSLRMHTRPWHEPYCWCACCLLPVTPVCESILIHELGHAVMNLGFNKHQMQRVHACYSHAKRHRLYDPGECAAAAAQGWRGQLFSLTESTVCGSSAIAVQQRAAYQPVSVTV